MGLKKRSLGSQELKTIDIGKRGVISRLGREPKGKEIIERIEMHIALLSSVS